MSHKPPFLTISTIKYASLIILLVISLAILSATNSFRDRPTHSRLEARMDTIKVLDAASQVYLQQAGVIDLAKLKILREAWNRSAVLSHDFNLDGITGWIGELGRFIIGDVTENLSIDYYTPRELQTLVSLDKALYLYANESAVVLKRPLEVDPSSVSNVRIATTALATRLDGMGSVTLHVGPYYTASSMGAVVSWGDLRYSEIAVRPIEGEAWILVKPTGTINIYSPMGALKIDGVSLYSVDEPMYIIEGKPYRVIEEYEGLIAKQANGGYQTYAIAWRDGIYTAITPGNPLILYINTSVNGALVLDLAPGYTRLPARLELYKLNGDRWVPVGKEVIIPAEGWIGFRLKAYRGDVYMLKSTSTIWIDRARLASVNAMSLEEARVIAVNSVKVEEGHASITYDAPDKGWVLLHTSVDTGFGEVIYSGGPLLTVYGGLFIINPSGAPTVNGAEWVSVSSDVVEIPGDASSMGLILVGYRYNGEPDSPLLVAYVKSLLYPVIASAGYPQSSYDITLHTEAVVGIKHVDVSSGEDLDLGLHLEVGSYRTSIAGSSYWGGPLDIPDVNVTFGELYVDEDEGCQPPNQVRIFYAVLDNSVQSTRPQGSEVYAGIADTISLVSTLGNVVAKLVSAIEGPSAITTFIDATSTASGVFAGIAELLFGATDHYSIHKSKVNYMDCVYFRGVVYITDYGWLDDYKYASMSYIGYYYIDFLPDDYGVLMGAVVFNKYVLGDYYSTDDDAIVIELYFIKPYGT
ncbi:MAG: hypothetical protein GSR85_08200 [Desulfurococcales archaeon]|nr:hypothetical protein [Desulfurococcales archaeon]